jgi:hypothetical protein
MVGAGGEAFTDHDFLRAIEFANPVKTSGDPSAALEGFIPFTPVSPLGRGDPLRRPESAIGVLQGQNQAILGLQRLVRENPLADQVGMIRIGRRQFSELLADPVGDRVTFGFDRLLAELRNSTQFRALTRAYFASLATPMVGLR